MFKLTNQNKKVLSDAKKYLGKFPDKEQGGLLVGIRVVDDFGNPTEIHLQEFVPILSNYSCWKGQKSNLQKLPPEEFGYFPDASECYKERIKLNPFNSKTIFQEVGFIHSHMMFEANPSAWDLNWVTKCPGYLMPIYSNKHDHIKIWIVNNNLMNNTEETKCQIPEKSQGFTSSGLVELVATF